MTLALFVETVQRTLEREGAAASSLLSLRAPLLAMAREREALAEAATAGLPSNYQPGVVILGMGEGWAVRVVAWEPTLPVDTEAHTHPFDLLTVGVLGPGYTTRIYDTDPEELARSTPGAMVSLQHAREASLPVGDVLFYPADAVAHMQQPPPAYSISLNVMRWQGNNPQYFIDPVRRVLLRRRNSRALRRPSSWMGFGSKLSGRTGASAGRRWRPFWPWGPWSREP